MKRSCDLLIFGSGPAGQKAAVQAAKSGLSVVVCEQLRQVGGACVQFGTIPSKTLRERAMERYRVVQSDWLAGGSRASLADTNVPELISEVEQILRGHDRYMSEQLRRNGIDVLHGRGAFDSPHEASIQHTDGSATTVAFRFALIATGSMPRNPANVAIDHEHVLDSDSILSMAYMPQSLLVIGGGVIACEYASIFALLGVRVIMVDRYERPLGFLDEDLSAEFERGFRRNGGTFVGERELLSAELGPLGRPRTRLHGEDEIETDKVLCAAGRVAQVAGLNLERCGVQLNDAGHIPVNEHGQTCVGHIYAAGDTVGPPALASTSMEQGRRAACHMLHIDPGSSGLLVPTGIYGVPELASVGLTEAQARAAGHEVLVGRASFAEVARGLIAGTQEGLLKLVADRGGRLLGVHIVGAQATELIHIGQMALIQGANCDIFIDNVFNFPTYAESYRIAALAVSGQRAVGDRSQVA